MPVEQIGSNMSRSKKNFISFVVLATIITFAFAIVIIVFSLSSSRWDKSEIHANVYEYLAKSVSNGTFPEECIQPIRDSLDDGIILRKEYDVIRQCRDSANTHRTRLQNALRDH